MIRWVCNWNFRILGTSSESPHGSHLIKFLYRVAIDKVIYFYCAWVEARKWGMPKFIHFGYHWRHCGSVRSVRCVLERWILFFPHLLASWDRKKRRKSHGSHPALHFCRTFGAMEVAMEVASNIPIRQENQLCRLICEKFKIRAKLASWKGEKVFFYCGVKYRLSHLRVKHVNFLSFYLFICE